MRLVSVSGKLVGHDATVTTEFLRDNNLSDEEISSWSESLAEGASRDGAGR